MTNTITSSIGIQLTTSSQLQTQLADLEKLNEQLASGKQNNDLTDYSPTAAQNLLNFQNSITQRQSYISSINTVQTRLSLYDSTMTDMESLATNAQALASQNTSYDPSKLTELQNQITNYLQQVGDDLNQQVGGRYVYSGLRYNTAPVTNLATLSSSVTYPFTPTTSPTLPSYDTAAVAGSTTSTAAFAQDSVNIDSGYNVQYGVTSNASAFQQLIAGLQLMNQATQTTNSTTYQADMNNASTLLGTALSGIQKLHTGVASNINLLTQETTTQNTDITDLQNQIGNIQNVDTATVSTEITALQSQLEASYSATGSILKLSLVNYL